MASKTQNCGKTRADWEKRLFIQLYVTLKLIESVEISHAPESLLHSDISADLQNFSKVMSDFVHDKTAGRTEIAESNTAKGRLIPFIIISFESDVSAGQSSGICSV